MVLFKEAHGAKLKKQNKKPHLFTKGTSPFEKDILAFVLGENIACPQYLPMNPADVNMTVTTCHAAIHDSEIPISEYMKKEFFYRCFTSFSTAIGAEPSLIADEVRRHCKRFDHLFGTIYQKS